MPLFKLVNNELVAYNGQCVVKDGKVYTNPGEELQYEIGYRPLGKGEVPEFDAETQIPKAISYHYSTDGSEIIPVYEVVELTTLFPTPLEDRISALEQAGLERDMALMELAEMLAGGEV